MRFIFEVVFWVLLVAGMYTGLAFLIEAIIKRIRKRG